MAEMRTTADHEEIQNWIENHGGKPGKEEGRNIRLRISFSGRDGVEEIEWQEFFEILDGENLALMYERNVSKDDDRPLREKYDFVVSDRKSSRDIPDTELDDDVVRSNTEETEG